MKIKPGLPARIAATIILTRVIDDGRGLDGLLDTRHGPQAYGNLSDADKSLVRAIATTAFRHRGEIEFALSKLLDRALPKNARHLIHTLHVAAAQILFLDVPDSAAVDLAVTALKEDSRSKRFASLGNAILRRMAREKEQIFDSQTPENLAVLNMAPWLRKRVKKAYGRDRLPAIASQHMLEPLIDLTVKSEPEAWAKKLGGVHLYANSIRVNGTGKIETWQGYEDGEWWVQDAAAHLPAHLLGDIRGKSVVDLCSAPGGKTAQLIAAGANVTAVEASEPRLERLQQNLERLKFQTNTVHANLLEWQPDQLFDAVLLDAPCSSTGTIRRHPDVQWTKSADIVEGLATLQRDMIVRAAQFLKPGGILVFANCSIDRTEGEDVFAQISKGNFGLIPNPITTDELFGIGDVVTGQGTLRTLPCHLQNISPPKDSTVNPQRFSGLDGFFAARFVRSDEAT
ncbi:MAG: transcription antitermination factor NusB [Rhizobiaceae bacterium]